MHITTHLDIDLVALDQADEVTCLLELTAPAQVATATRPGRTLVLVVDRSGSMSGEPLEAAKDAISRLVRRLAPQDCFGLVVFDDQADVVIPTMSMADHAMEPLQRAIAAIDAGGTTDLSAGYLLALREAKRSLATTGHSSATVLIVSDGQANAGITEPDRLSKVAGGALAKGVVTSTLGLGLDYDEVLLDAVTRAGNGNHRFAPDIDTAVSQMQQTVADLLDVSALATTVRITPIGDVVDAIRVYQDLPIWREPGSLTINIGDLYAGEERKLLISLAVPAVNQLGTCQIADISIDFTQASDLAEHHVVIPVNVNVVPGDQARGQVPNPVVQVERLLAQTDAAKKAATSCLRDDDHAGAQSNLNSALNRIDDLRSCLTEIGEDRLISRLQDVHDDISALQESVVSAPPMFAMKLMTDSLAVSSRGRKSSTRRPTTKPAATVTPVPDDLWGDNRDQEQQ